MYEIVYLSTFISTHLWAHVNALASMYTWLCVSVIHVYRLRKTIVIDVNKQKKNFFKSIKREFLNLLVNYRWKPSTESSIKLSTTVTFPWNSKAVYLTPADTSTLVKYLLVCREPPRVEHLCMLSFTIDFYPVSG